MDSFFNVAFEYTHQSNIFTCCVCVELCTFLPLIQEQFDKLLLCQPLVVGRHLHPVDAAAMALLIKDGFRIHSMLTVQMLHILGIQMDIIWLIL
jgi:hypothetical protein